MANQGFSFGNFLNNQPSVDWSNIPAGGFKGAAFQSLLQPPVAAAAENWRSTPGGYLSELAKIKKEFPDATPDERNKALSINPPNSRFENSLATAVEQSAYNQSPAGMAAMLKMGSELAKEQARETLKYQTLANLPGQIERAFAADKYYEGISRIPEIYRATFASVPSMNIQAPGYSSTQRRYFN
jgi:hypothetical protein